MKILFRLFVLWCSISLLFLVSCKSHRKQKTESTTIEQPKPGTEAQTDSLKFELDKERERRLKEKQPR